jgi:competence protein ComFC
MESKSENPVSFFDQILDSLLNLFYPEVCFICADPIVHRKERGVCTKCLNKARDLRLQPPVCSSCGLPMPNFESGADVLCGECVLQPPAYSGARSFGYYSGELGRLIQGLKFNNRRNLAALLVPFMIQVFNGWWNRDDFDLVVPIPLHPKRRRNRGYNQSELLARGLAHRTGIPFGNRVLIRKRSTPPQVGLTDTQRRQNVRNAFHCINSGGISGRRILLIDDVMTTGATASSASGALMKGGALRVSVLTLARTE